MERSYLSFKEEFLTCTICSCVFTNPCTLTCGHSFCRVCLQTYLLTSGDAIQANSLPCAYCRQFTKAPNPQEPPEDWADQISCSLLLTGLLDRLKDRREERDAEGKDVCFLCQEVGEVTAATCWCSDCEITLCSKCKHMHQEIPSTKKHDLFGLSEDPKVKLKRKARCKDHGGKKIHFYCKDCSAIACQTCFILKHRPCRNVVDIREMTSIMRSTLTELKDRLDTKVNHHLIVQNLEKASIEKLERLQSYNSSRLQNFVKTTMSLLNSRLEKNNSNIEKEIRIQLMLHSVKFLEVARVVASHKKYSDYISKSLKSEADLFEDYQLCKSGAQETLEEDVTLSPRECASEVYDKIIRAIEDNDWQHRVQKLTKEISTAVFYSEKINIRHASDFRAPRVGEITLQYVNNLPLLIVTDTNNRCLKFVIGGGLLTTVYSLTLPEEPFRMAKHESKEVVCTLGNCTILIAEINLLKGPSIKSIIDTGRQYLGITSLPEGMLAVSSSSHPFSVDILNLTGNVLKSFTFQSPGLELMDNPYNLCSMSNCNICITDATSRLIHCITPLGQLVFASIATEGRSYSNATVTEKGNILITDYETNRMFLLDKKGCLVREICPTGTLLGKPLSAVADNSGFIYLCEDDAPYFTVYTLNERSQSI